jgi:CHAT domain-containing protein
MSYIKEVTSNLSPAHTTLVESNGAVEQVLSAMKESDWVHFACHGVQDLASPTESGLCLADQRRLKLSDIIHLSRSRGGLAFLSACQTATGDKELSEEAVHLAAGMLLAGYGSVIGTMWSIQDNVAPEVAKDVYEQLLRGDGVPNYREAARALHGAVERLCRPGYVKDDALREGWFLSWVPFIHVGL